MSVTDSKKGSIGTGNFRTSRKSTKETGQKISNNTGAVNGTSTGPKTGTRPGDMNGSSFGFKPGPRIRAQDGPSSGPKSGTSTGAMNGPPTGPGARKSRSQSKTGCQMQKSESLQQELDEQLKYRSVQFIYI